MIRKIKQEELTEMLKKLIFEPGARKSIFVISKNNKRLEAVSGGIINRWRDGINQIRYINTRPHQINMENCSLFFRHSFRTFGATTNKVYLFLDGTDDIEWQFENNNIDAIMVERSV